MARDFSPTEYGRIVQLAVTDFPFTVSGWFKTNSATTNQSLFWIGDKDDAQDWNAIIVAGNVTDDPLRVFSHDHGLATGTATTTNFYVANKWHHAAGTFVSQIRRRCYLDGDVGNRGNDGTDIGSARIWDSMAIGSHRDSSPGAPFDGLIADVGMWDVELSEDEIESLAAGYSPQLIRPQNLVAYWPMHGRGNTMLDPVGGFNMTLTGAPQIDDHPRIILPSRPRLFLPVAAVAGLPAAEIAPALQFQNPPNVRRRQPVPVGY